MNRRQHLRSFAASAVTSAAFAAAAEPIVLLVDLEVDPARTQDLVTAYRTVFRPAIRKQPGFADVRLLKLRSEAAGKAPAGCTHRLLVSFETEGQRLKWVASSDHQKAWPTIEKCLKGQKYIALVYDAVS